MEITRLTIQQLIRLKARLDSPTRRKKRKRLVKGEKCINK